MPKCRNTGEKVSPASAKFASKATKYLKPFLTKGLRIFLYTYIPMNSFNFLKKHGNHCTLILYLSASLSISYYKLVCRKQDVHVVHVDPVLQHHLFSMMLCNLRVHSNLATLPPFDPERRKTERGRESLVLALLSGAHTDICLGRELLCTSLSLCPGKKFRQGN